MIETASERNLLLKTGFTGKQIEALYLVLNRFEIMGVAWDEAVVKPACFLGIFKQPYITIQTAGTQAAPPQGVKA